MKTQFQIFNFRKDTLNIIDQANEIINDFQMQGYDLTLRQLYYQFVAKDLLPNSQKSYNRLGNIINDARLNGDVDWNAIKDRTRSKKDLTHWDNVEEVIEGYAHAFRLDSRISQFNYIEVWVEKEALAGVIQKACNQIDLPWFACRGYVSQTAMYDAAQRFKNHIFYGQRGYILHLGDHDPSGIDMTRDIQERLRIFEADVEVRRIALNMEQIKKYNPPPNPAKLTDSRVGHYLKNYGKLSWELDALNPSTITNLIHYEAGDLTDEDKRQQIIQEQENQKEILNFCSENWEKIEELYNKH